MDNNGKNRRNDIGYKAAITVLLGIISVFVGLFVNQAVRSSEAARQDVVYLRQIVEAQRDYMAENKNDISVLKSQYDYICYTLEEIKADVKEMKNKQNRR